jgi:hypothetical protein
MELATFPLRAMLGLVPERYDPMFQRSENSQEHQDPDADNLVPVRPVVFEQHPRGVVPHKQESPILHFNLQLHRHASDQRLPGQIPSRPKINARNQTPNRTMVTVMRPAWVYGFVGFQRSKV